MGMLPPTPSSRVNVPGIGLIVTGALGIVTSLGFMLLWGLGGIAALADEDAADALGGIGVLMGLTVIGLLISAFVTYAGLQMRQLRSWGAVMAGAILAMLPCGPCCLLGLPMGIWAILVLIDEEVKAAFGGGAPGGGGSDGGYGEPSPYSPPPPPGPPPPPPTWPPIRTDDPPTGPRSP